MNTTVLDWTIDNYFDRIDKPIYSPPFTIPDHPQIDWRLKLFQSCYKNDSKKFASIHLCKLTDEFEAEVEFELAVIGADGKSRSTTLKHLFECENNSNICVWPKFASKTELINNFLVNGSLTIQVRNVQVIRVVELKDRLDATVFSWDIDKLMTLSPIELVSDKFTITGLPLIKWQLTCNSNDFVSIFLKNCTEDSEIEIEHRLMIVGRDEENPETRTDKRKYVSSTVEKNCQNKTGLTISRDDLINGGYLIDGTLMIQVKVFRVLETDYLDNYLNCCFKRQSLDLNSLFDFRLKTGDKTFDVHKYVLARESSYFKTMFDSDFKEKEKNEVNLSQFQEDVIQEVLRFVYTGQLRNFDQFSEQLFIAADYFQMHDLKTLCQENMTFRISIHNCLQFLLIAEQNNFTFKTTVMRFLHKYRSHIDKQVWKQFFMEHLDIGIDWVTWSCSPPKTEEKHQEELKTDTIVFSWTIDNFLDITKKELFSPSFTIADCPQIEWRLWLCPNGNDESSSGFVSLFLTKLTDELEAEIECNLVMGKDKQKNPGYLKNFFDGQNNFRSFGWKKYLNRSQLADEGFLVDGSLKIQVKNVRVFRVFDRLTDRLNAIVFNWNIDNFMSKEDYQLTSDTFTIPGHPLIKWQLICKPKNTSDSNFVSIFLKKCKKDHAIEMEYQLVVVGEDDKRFDYTLKYHFNKYNVYFGRENFINRNELVDSGYLIDGTLRFQVKVRRIYQFDYFDYYLNQYFEKKQMELDSLFDFRLKADDKTFDVHKFVLARKSSYFKKLFDSDSQEKNKTELDLSQFRSEVIQEVVRFIYTGQLQNFDATSDQLIIAADYLKMDYLKTICQENMTFRLSLDNCLQFLLIAKQINSTDMKEAAMRFLNKNKSRVLLKRNKQKLTNFFKEHLELGIDWLVWSSS